MAEEKPPTWFIATTLSMLIVTGAWTLASTIPFNTWLRIFSIATVTAANIGFLLALLACVLAYLKADGRITWRRIMVYAFTIGVLFLMTSIVTYAASVMTGFPFPSD